MALMFPLLFLVLGISAYIPVTLTAEQAFERLLGRYFGSCAYLTSTLARDPRTPMTWVDRWLQAFHVHEISTLPARLGAWAKFVEARAQSGKPTTRARALVSNLPPLTRRMQELLEERAQPHSQQLVEVMRSDFRAWRLTVQENFRKLAADPSGPDCSADRAGLEEIMNRLERRTVATLNQEVPRGVADERTSESFYRLLGAFRALSQALVDHAGTTRTVAWIHLREARFA